ncbi:MAG: MFS transporter [Burkholderiales bacterium]|nr:MFS transporter [Burkholderiales bacterium]
MKIFSLPATVWLLGAVSFVNDSAGELVYTVLPLFVATMAGPAVLGLLEGVAEASGSLFKLFSGVVSDRMGSTKGWVLGGYGIAALSRPLLGLAGSWPAILALRFADRLGKGLRTSPRDALLASSVDASKRGLAFGLHRSMDNAGAVAGPLAAAFLLSRHMGLREVLLYSALPGLLVMLFALFVREPEKTTPKKRSFDWRLGNFPVEFRRYLLVLALFTLGNSSNMFLLLRAKELGLAEAQVPLLWALTSLIAAIFSTPFSALSDRIGRKTLILAGWGIYGIFYLAIGLNGKVADLWLLFAFYGLFLAATEGVEKAYVADFAPPALLGSAYGWFNMTTGIMLLPASLLFGAIWQLAGAQAAFAFSSICAVSASLLLAFRVKPTGT